MQNIKIDRNVESIGVVHTHTHTSTFREIKRVANEATLYCVENRVTVVLYGKKIVLSGHPVFLLNRKI